MRKRASGTDPADMTGKRLFSLSEGCIYTGTGRTSFRAFAENIGAVKHFGKRVLFDRKIIDAALDSGIQDLKKIRGDAK